MLRTNSFSNMASTGEADLDLGAGVTARIPVKSAERVKTLETAMVTIDNTVGRRAFAWDAGNARQQMVYGDTGWRQLVTNGSGVAADNTGAVHLRRTGLTVWIRFANVKPADPSASLANMGTLITAGFRPVDNQAFGFIGDTGALSPHIVAIFNKGVVYVQRPTNFASTIPDGNYQGTFSFPTDDAWPTTLPGTAIGTPA